jgi:hypothetical protein
MQIGLSETIIQRDECEADKDCVASKSQIAGTVAAALARWHSFDPRGKAVFWALLGAFLRFETSGRAALAQVGVTHTTAHRERNELRGVH